MSNTEATADTHSVASVEPLAWPFVRVTCSCGYWQQVRKLAYFESIWLADHKDLFLQLEIQP